MRQKFTVTITDFRGSRQYSLHQLARTFALIFALGLILILSAGAGVIVWLQSEVGALEDRRDSALQEYARLQEVNGALMETVEQKNSQLDVVTTELGEIESLIGLQPEGDADIVRRLDTASHTALERTTFLQNVPSGFPMRNRGVTSEYGWRTHPVQGERRFHPGIDLRAPVGTPVMTTADGVIEYAGYHQDSGFGNLIIVNHNFGFRTYYAHLDGFEVEPGDFVRKGEVIATSGETGVTAGPHLHYEVWHIQRRLNPEPFLEWSLSDYETIFEEKSRVKWDALLDAVRMRLNAPVHRLTMRESNVQESIEALE
ncbi:M23 family metallopeptidase [Aquisalimonas sp.]|uniref:M23 family metallopeptidase n=1 Tax=unclassified Aquisalimonas TaxID=2644645 RepID=UPI0025C05496|nr:M23 family metallopeptidase [Aquisalimonas sp.]